MSPGSDLVSQRFEGTSGPVGLREVLPERGRHGVAEVRERASEKLTARLELRPQPEEAERVVAGDVDPMAHLVKQRIERPPALDRKAFEPRRHQLRGALVHRLARAISGSLLTLAHERRLYDASHSLRLW